MTQEEGVTWHNTIATAPKPGYLSVRLITRIGRKPIADLPVRFYKSDARGTQGGEITTEELKSDEKGWAHLDQIVDAGCYLCVVVDETSEVIMPVEKKEEPEDILLPRGFLAVRVHYYGDLLGDLEVAFYGSDENGNRSDDLLGKVKTDYDGTASLWNEVKIGNYFGVVEDQEEASISTVEDRQNPYELSLPIGRSQVDMADEAAAAPPKAIPAEGPGFAGYLAVRVLYENEPYPEAMVTFFTVDEDGKKGIQLAQLPTDEKGLADTGMMFIPGNYLCEVDQEGEFSVSTVEGADKPYVIELPVGRSSVSDVVDPGAAKVVPIPVEPAPLAGYLAVRLLRRDTPEPDAGVAFYSIDVDGNPAGAPMVAISNVDGVASLSDMFTVGNYLVEVDGATATISTIESLDNPYPLQLPLGTSLIAEDTESSSTPPSPVPDLPAGSGGYLSVKVLFEGEPYEGLTVPFYALDSDGKRGLAVAEVATDVEGLATADGLFAVGNYLCEVEGEEVSLTTVEAASSPYVVLLPVGRSSVSEPEAYPEGAAPSPIPEQPAIEPEYLAVRVTSKGTPAAGVKVEFYTALKGGKKGDLIGRAITDAGGNAVIDGTFEYGTYLCAVEDGAGGGAGVPVESTVSPTRPVAVERAGQ